MVPSKRLRFYFSIFVASLGLGMYIYFVPIFAQRFGATFLDLGYIGTVSSLTYVVTPIIVGHIADRVSRLRLYALALLINFIATITLAFTRSIGDIVLLRSLGGLGFAFFWPTAEILVLDFAPMEKRVKEMGVFSVSWGSGFLIGPLLGGIVIQKLGFINLFVISSALMMLAFLQTISFSVMPDGRKMEGRTLQISSQFHVMKQLLPWYLMIACYGIIFSVVTAIFPGYANSVGVNAVLVGVIFTAFGISRVAVFATSDAYLHFGEKKALTIVSLLIIGASLAIALYSTFNAFLLAISLLGGCFAIIFPLSISLISRHFPNEQAGVAVGSYESAYGIGSAIGPILAGAVAAWSDVRFSFVSASVFAILMVILASTGKTYHDTKQQMKSV